jgi:outer membrane protein TolC
MASLRLSQSLKILLSTALVLHPCAASGAEPVANSFQCQSAKIQGSDLAQFPNLRFCRDVEAPRAKQIVIEPDQYLKQSLLKSQQLQSQRDLVDSATYNIKAANGAWWPNVSMSNSSLLFVNNSGNNNPVTTGCVNSVSTAGKAFNPFNGSSGGTSCSASGDYTQLYPVITITWNFINPSRYPQIAGAKKSKKLAESQLRQTNQQLQLSLLKNYGSYLLSGFQLGELLGLVELQQKILTSTKSLVGSTTLPRFARNQEARSLLAYQARIETVLASQKQAYAALQSALDTSLQERVSFVPDINALLLKSWNYDEQSTLNMAMEQSEVLKQLALQSGIATDNANQLRGSILPTIGFLGYVTYQGTSTSNTYSGLLSNYAGLSVSWNLFDGYSTKNQAIASDRQASSYNAQLADATAKLRLQVTSKLTSLSSLRRLILLYLNDIQQTDLIAADHKARQRYGFSTSFDVMQAEQDSRESRLQLLGTIANYVVTYAELSSLCGLDPSQ